MTTVDLSLDQAVREGTILVREIGNLDLKAAPSLWELADLTASVVHTKSSVKQREQTERLGLSEWAEQIGWTELGRKERSLTDMVQIARNWPEEYRVEKASLWQHREAFDHFDGDVKKASEWLASNTRPRSVRDVTRSGVMGTGPIFDAIRVLIRARADIVRVPAILAKADALGTEPNFDQLRSEIVRLKKGMAYLDRYLADEITIDMDELQAGLDKILKEAS